MPPKTLLQAGIITLLTGIALFVSIPIGLAYVEIYPVSYSTVAQFFSGFLAHSPVQVDCWFSEPLSDYCP
jgi:hypothetical protein